MKVKKYHSEISYIKETMKNLFMPCLISGAHNLRNIITFYSIVSRSHLISTMDPLQKVLKREEPGVVKLWCRGVLL